MSKSRMTADKINGTLAHKEQLRLLSAIVTLLFTCTEMLEKHIVNTTVHDVFQGNCQHRIKNNEHKIVELSIELAACEYRF